MEIFAHRIAMSDDAVGILSKAYNWNIKNLIRWITLKNRYEVRVS